MDKSNKSAEVREVHPYLKKGQGAARLANLAKANKTASVSARLANAKAASLLKVKAAKNKNLSQTNRSNPPQKRKAVVQETGRDVKRKRGGESSEAEFLLKTVESTKEAIKMKATIG